MKTATEDPASLSGADLDVHVPAALKADDHLVGDGSGWLVLRAFPDGMLATQQFNNQCPRRVMVKLLPRLSGIIDLVRAPIIGVVNEPLVFLDS
jgi:hypothetical protein